MNLHATGKARGIAGRLIGRITTRGVVPSQRAESVYFWDGASHAIDVSGYMACITCSDSVPDWVKSTPSICGVPSLSYLAEGDVVLVTATGFVRVMYRRNSNQNFLLVAENCNSYCLMCSQPPRPVDDLAKVDEHLRVIELIDPETTALGLTGGEPTLLGGRFFDMISHCKAHLPRTALHVLTNGRRFSDGTYARAVAAIGHPDLMLGIPLYSDIDFQHDYVVQVPGAFDETVAGLHNLARSGVAIEIRVVLHRQTYRRLPQLAEFLARNLTFAGQVALMGLEVTGLTLAHPEDIWIDPADYQGELYVAAEHLGRSGMTVRLYNHQLCVLDRRLWRYAVRSISDWKQTYLPACEACSAQDACGGVFETSRGRHSTHIQPFLDEPGGDEVGRSGGRDSRRSSLTVVG